MIDFVLSTAALSLAAVLFLETLFPLHAAAAPLRRWGRNLLLSALALASTLATPLLFWWVVSGLGYAPGREGMAQWGVPVWGQWVVTFLMLDGVAYALHRLSHVVPWLWRLHAVHHSDLELDATTTHRHHPLEAVVTALVNLPVLVLLAPPVPAVLAYSVVATVVSTLSHGNLRLPPGLDRVLRPWVVTPAYHRLHHSAAQHQTDTNYATVLPVFDRCLGSAGAVPGDGGQTLTIGLETERTLERQSLAALLLAPFRSPR